MNETAILIFKIILILASPILVYLYAHMFGAGLINGIIHTLSKFKKQENNGKKETK
jgi:hypothetical protein